MRSENAAGAPLKWWIATRLEFRPNGFMCSWSANYSVGVFGVLLGCNLACFSVGVLWCVIIFIRNQFIKVDNLQHLFTTACTNSLSDNLANVLWAVRQLDQLGVLNQQTLVFFEQMGGNTFGTCLWMLSTTLALVDWSMCWNYCRNEVFLSDLHIFHAVDTEMSVDIVAQPNSQTTEPASNYIWKSSTTIGRGPIPK